MSVAFRIEAKKLANVRKFSSAVEGEILITTGQILKHSKRMGGVVDSGSFHKYVNELAKLMLLFPFDFDAFWSVNAFKCLQKHCKIFCS